MKSELKPIGNEDEYQAAIGEIEPYFDRDEPVPNTPESEHFEALFARIEEYEAKHYPIDAPENNDQEMNQFLNDLINSVKEMKSVK